MRNLLLLLSRYYHVFLFLLLEAVCFFLIFTYNPYQSTAFMNASNAIAGNFFETTSEYRSYFRLAEVNDSLQAENAQLRQQLQESYYELDTTLTVQEDSLLQQKYTYITARVINNSIEKGYNYLTLNKGSILGVTSEMGVISPDGVVGIVNAVSPHFSTAVSILHRDFSLSARIPAIGEIGSIRWDGQDPYHVVMRDVPLQANVEIGQEVVTSSYSTIFPEGVPIGTISAVEEPRSSNFYTIQIRLAANMRNLQRVYIINNLMKGEQDQLEEEVVQ